MEYVFKDGKIFQDNNEVYAVKTESAGMAARSIDITSQGGFSSFSINRAPGGYKITQGSMDMGNISRNLAMNYNGRNYTLSRPYMDGNSRKMDIASDGTKVGTLTFGSDMLTATYDFMNDEGPVVVYMALLSPYIKSAYANPNQQGAQNTRANMYRMPRIYAIMSNVVFLIAIVFILLSSYIPGFNEYYDFGILIGVIIISYGIRAAGRKKYMEQQQNNDENGMNKNL
ncbi:MAG: hypothetical protein QXZ44_04240 [Ferroplasma sp.]